MATLGKVSQFLKNRYVTTTNETDIVKEDYEHSDFGRIYGWWVCIDGMRVASLDYRCFLEEPVHLYSVTILDARFLQIDFDSDKWLTPSVSIQSRYAEQFSKEGLHMAGVGDNMIVVENLYLPESYFRKQHNELAAFHHGLLQQSEEA